MVRHPLPVYPPNKIILTEDEGMEVAADLGGHKAVLPLGHGATTTGASLSEAAMNRYQLEEQAKMNWYACCAAGPQHRRIPEELIAESDNRTPIHELPHLKELFGGVPPRPNNGVWLHYADLVSRDL